MDERSFTRMAEEYAARLYVVAYRLLGNRADAEDAVQRTLMKCFAARRSYSPRWAVSTWLYRALGNVCMDELRRRRHVPTEADGGARARYELSRKTAPGGDRIDLERALGKVPREARLLLALRYGDGLSYRELARIRGISINTVKSQLARGKAILKATLVEDGHDGSDR